MPRGDGTGPLGMGSMTGRAAGYCAGYGVPGFANVHGYGRGLGSWGRGHGGGRGRGRWFSMAGFTGSSAVGLGWRAAPDAPASAAGMTGQQEIDALKGQAEHLEGLLDNLRRRIEELQSTADKA